MQTQRTTDTFSGDNSAEITQQRQPISGENLAETTREDTNNEGDEKRKDDQRKRTAEEAIRRDKRGVLSMGTALVGEAKANDTSGDTRKYSDRETRLGETDETPRNPSRRDIADHSQEDRASTGSERRQEPSRALVSGTKEHEAAALRSNGWRGK